MFNLNRANKGERNALTRVLPLTVVLLLAIAFVCIYNLHNPPGIAHDGTNNLADGLRISRGIPFPAVFESRPEPLYRFILAAWFVVTGPTLFTARILQSFTFLLTAAAVFQATALVLKGRSWRGAGALAATVALASMGPVVYQGNRMPDRHNLLLLTVPATFCALLLAYRAGKSRQWLWLVGGFLAGLGMDFYTAGLLMPGWPLGLLIHQWLMRYRPGVRWSWRNVLLAIAGLFLPVLAWVALVWLVPGVYYHAQDLGAQTTLTPLRLLTSAWLSLRSMFIDGDVHPYYNIPHVPLLNPALAVVSVIGLLLAVWRWRTPQGALILGGMALFMAPAVLSPEPGYPYRLYGVIPLIAITAGWGTSAVLSALLEPSNRRSVPRLDWLSANRGARSLVWLILLAVIALSISLPYANFHRIYGDASQYVEPLEIASWNTIAFTDAMSILAKVDQPTYVPLWLLDNPAANFYLQREAFPNVTTWARYQLKELPAGQYFLPAYWYFHFPLPPVDASSARVLLLPSDKTMVILPGEGLPAAILQPPFDQATEIRNDIGWVVARTVPVPLSDFTPPTLTANLAAPGVGKGLQLLTSGASQSAKIEPGKSARVVVNWLVTERQPADIFSVVQLVSGDFSQVPAGDSHQVYAYLYPSARWQPGDIVPDWHEIPIPGNLANGLYRWGVGAFVPPGAQRRSITPPDADDHGPQLADMWLWDAIRWPETSTPTVNPLPNMQHLNAQLGQHIALESYNLENTADGLKVALLWRALDKVPGDYTVFVHVLTGEKMLAQHDEKPQGGQLPTWAWRSGETVLTSVTLPLPANAESADAVYVGMYSYPSLARLPVTQDGSARDDGRVKLPLNR